MIPHTDWSVWQRGREAAMCPACLSTTALLLAGAGSGGVSALLAHRLWRRRKEETMTTQDLPHPTFTSGRALLVAGLREDYTFARRQQIPGQWRRFGERWFGRVPGGVGREAYGIVLSPPAGGGADFSYVCGVEVSDLSLVPTGLHRLTVPACRQARFVHEGPVTGLPGTIDGAMAWLRQSGLAIDPAAQPDVPGLVEWYGASFDPATGRGDMEVWVPVRG
ncbi:MAG: GyrI-like domain-containing protein [Vicinamibacteria bacterium]